MSTTRTSLTLRAAGARVLCRAKYEPWMPRDTTHTCNLPRDHAGAHQCPVSGDHWFTPGGAVAETYPREMATA